LQELLDDLLVIVLARLAEEVDLEQ
jgi:hypothetical protein